MASVPRNRSGMGSAMNDVTRQLGSALGVAVLGATLSATYTTEIAATASAFTGKTQGLIESSLAVALAVADHLGPAGNGVIEAAKTAWMDGLTAACTLGAVILTISTFVAFFGLPKHIKGDKDA